MANGFAFPPPPPPPPPPATSHSSPAGYISQRPQQPNRGRGGFNSGFSRGGRGGNSRPGHGDSRGYGSGPRSGYSFNQRNGFQSTNQNDSWRSTQSKPHQPAWSYTQTYTNGHNQSGYKDHQHRSADQHGAKRSYTQAFQNKSSTTTKLQAAPAVPSFGFELPSPIAQKKPNPPKDDLAASQKRKLLGLIPLEDEGDASDEDEEAKLASALASKGTELSFSYKGKLATLRNPDEIAAWIAERRRNYPTAARGEAMAKQKAKERMEAAEKEGAMRKKILEAKKAIQPKINQQSALPAAGKGTKGSKPPVAKGMRSSSVPTAETPLLKQQQKMERLRKIIAKNAKQLAKLEAASKSSRAVVSRSTVSISSANTKGNTDVLDDSTTSDSDISSEDETSSSDLSASEDSDTSSDSDLDESSADEVDTVINKASNAAMTEDPASDSDAPQELSSVPTIPAPRGKREDKRALCRNVQSKGQCRKRGCKFRHKVKDGEIIARTQSLARKPAPRMSLYQRLLKQQIEEEEQAQQGTKADSKIAIAV